MKWITSTEDLGKAKNKIEGVNTVIGELLGIYPKIPHCLYATL